MSGFGKDLEKRTIKTKLFRKVSLENYIKKGVICFSTEYSEKLIEQGDFALVLEEDVYTGMYCPYDADAGKYYGYDEFRVEINNVSELIIDIVVPDWWIAAIDDEYFEYADDPEKDPAIWVDNIMEDYNFYTEVISSQQAERMYGIDFNM